MARLKKTSIDYTVCDENDTPLLCIEFDGLQDGFNVGMSYHPAPSRTDQPNPWRKEITELKLKIAYCSFFPFFVVGSRYFEDISNETKLMLIDGIIGDVLASRAKQDRFATPFDPSELGCTAEEWNTLAEYEQNEVIQDWVLGVEVEAEMEHNPVPRLKYELMTSLNITRWGSEYLEYPSADKATSALERAHLIEHALLHGARVTLHTPDHGDIPATVWLPNYRSFSPVSFGLAEELAFIVAAERLQHRRNSLT